MDADIQLEIVTIGDETKPYIQREVHSEDRYT